MMSLNNSNFSKVVIKQAKWKWKTYSQALVSLVILQIIIAFLTSGGSGMYGGGFNGFNIDIHLYSLDVFIIITCLWAFITALLTQTKAYQQVYFSMVTNRVTANLANIIVLVIYSIIATIITFMSLYIVVATSLLFSETELIRETFLFSPMQFAVALFMILLATASGYFIGAAFYLSKLFGVAIIVLGIFVLLSLEEQMLTVLTFFFEAGYPLFIVNASGVSALLFAFAVIFTSRKEVVRR